MNDPSAKEIQANEINRQGHKWYHANWTMMPTKLAYFFNDARRLGFAPNLVMFLIAIGLKKEESGLIMGVG